MFHCCPDRAEPLNMRGVSAEEILTLISLEPDPGACGSSRCRGSIYVTADD
jgi:hypothetical protein